MQMWKLVRDRRSIKEKGRLATASESSSTEDKIKTDTTQDTARHPEVHENPGEQMENETAESDIREKRAENEKNANIDRKPISIALLSPIELVGKCFGSI